VSAPSRDIHDHWFREAKRQGYLSRAAFKLVEIDERREVLRKGDRVLDCGAAPGSWLQVAARRVGRRGEVVGIDLQPIRHDFRDAPVRCVEGDFTTIDVAELLGEEGEPFDVVLSDMAPSTTGDPAGDHHASVRLVRAVLERCAALLRPGGKLVVKVFEGEAYPDLLADMKACFETVKGFRPAASRRESREMFVVASGFRPDDAPRPSDDPHAVARRRPSPPPGWSRR
jgi:23S rRNA (uridine2552-2'-O)-methyltransferase